MKQSVKVPEWFTGTPEDYELFSQQAEIMGQAEEWLDANEQLWKNGADGLVLLTDNAPDYVKEYVADYNETQSFAKESAKIKKALTK